MTRIILMICMITSAYCPSVFCMEEEEKKEGLSIQVPIIFVDRTTFPANGVIIYDATFKDCPPIMAHLVTSGTYEGYMGIKRSTLASNSQEPFDVSTFLQKLYPERSISKTIDNAYAPVYEHLIRVLDAEYVKRHPEEKAYFKIQE